MSDELRPCMVCNKSDKIRFVDKSGRRSPFVECGRCYIAKSVEDWNTRPIEDDLRAKLAHATAALEAMRFAATNDELNPTLLSVESIARHALSKIRST